MEGVVKKKVVKRERIRTSTEKKNPNYIKSWNGKEHLESMLVKLTVEYIDASNSLIEDCGSDDMIHNTIAAMNRNHHKIKNENLDKSILVSQKLTKLVNYSSKLIYKYNMSPDLVSDTKNKYICQ